MGGGVCVGGEGGECSESRQGKATPLWAGVLVSKLLAGILTCIVEERESARGVGSWRDDIDLLLQVLLCLRLLFHLESSSCLVISLVPGVAAGLGDWRLAKGEE